MIINKLKAKTTAVGPLEKSNLKAKYNETGGITAPTKVVIIKTLIIFLPRSIPIEEGMIKNAKAKTSPTNLVVIDIPIPTIK